MTDDPLGLGKTGEELVKQAVELVKPLLRPGTEEAGEMIADQIRYWRFKRYVVLVEKAKKFLRDRNIEPRGIPLKLLLPMLNSGSLEDDEYLIDKWAGLLASAAAGDLVHPSYPRILDELAPDEAKILDTVYQRYLETTGEEQHLLTVEELMSKPGVPYSEIQIAIANLKRLELLDVPAFTSGDPIFHVDTSRELPWDFKARLTSLGHGFVKACRG